MILKCVTQPNGLSEQMIEQTETAPSWPLNVMTQTLQVRADAKVLKLERFDRGCRQMVIMLTRDAGQMERAERFLSEVDSARP